MSLYVRLTEQLSATTQKPICLALFSHAKWRIVTFFIRANPRCLHARTNMVPLISIGGWPLLPLFGGGFLPPPPTLRL